MSDTPRIRCTCSPALPGEHSLECAKTPTKTVLNELTRVARNMRQAEQQRAYFIGLATKKGASFAEISTAVKKGSGS